MSSLSRLGPSLLEPGAASPRRLVTQLILLATMDRSRLSFALITVKVKCK